MTLPTYEQVLATSRDRWAFSNGTEWECWSANNCMVCVRDAYPDVDDDRRCPMLDIALFEKRTPAEWIEDKPNSLYERYRCMYFRSEDDGPDPEPTPIPDPPGQLTLLPREPYEQARMLTTYPTPAEVAR